MIPLFVVHSSELSQNLYTRDMKLVLGHNFKTDEEYKEAQNSRQNPFNNTVQYLHSVHICKTHI